MNINTSSNIFSPHPVDDLCSLAHTSPSSGNSLPTLSFPTIFHLFFKTQSSDTPPRGPSLPPKRPQGALHKPLPLQGPLFSFGFLNIYAGQDCCHISCNEQEADQQGFFGS